MASTIISRTQSGSESAAGRRTFTFSCWFKKLRLGGFELFGSDSDGARSNNYFIIDFNGTDQLDISEYVSGSQFRLITSRKFRDTSAWYHLVVAFDTTQGTSSNRVKIYVNGVQETAFDTENYPSQDYQTRMFAQNKVHAFGRSGGQFDGLISHCHATEGTAYAPTVFGSTDSTTGEWKINTTPTVSYGTNGFFLFKDDNAVTNQAGNSSGDFAVTAGTFTKSEDNPSNVFNVLNSIHPSASNFTISNGNTTIYKSGTGQLGGFLGTIMPTTGKWYWEAKITEAANGDRTRVGVANYESVTGTSTIQGNYSGLEVSCKNAQLFTVINGTTTETYASGAYSDGDVVNIAMDLDNKAIYVGRNGTYVTLTGTSGGDPTSGANKTGAIITDTTYILNGSPMCVYFGHYAGASDVSNVSFNFGNGYFGTTAVSSAGTNASNNGIFEYDVPTGYTALSTRGLNL